MTDRAEGLYSASNNRELDIAFKRPDPMLAIDIARVCHEVNRAYCAVLDDRSQKPWDEAPQWQKDSALSGVMFHLQNPHATPENSHEKWLSDKTLAGWTYGPVKDEDKREHPCFMPYDQLPVEQKAKDYLFRAVVHALAHG